MSRPSPKDYEMQPRHSSVTRGRSDSATVTAPAARHTAISPTGLFYMALLAVQFGSQPLITTTFTPRSLPTSAIVLVTEIVKFGISFSLMYMEGSVTSALKGWTLRGSLAAAAFPAVTYSVQNICIQIAFQNLDPLVYNLVNQTKLLSTAVLTYLLLGKRQSPQQLVALAMLFGAAALITLGQTAEPSDPSGLKSVKLGMICVLTASCLSGLGSAISELALQTYNRNSYLFSAELAVYSSVALIIGEIFSHGRLPPVGEAVSTWTMLIPIFTAAMGGIFVGQVTKHAGSVQKGFSIIGGIILTACLRSVFLEKPMTGELLWAAPLTAGATFLYAKYPYKSIARNGGDAKE